MNGESMFEPQRGGKELARAAAAPTELELVIEGAWCYKDIAPTELNYERHASAEETKPHEKEP